MHKPSSNKLRNDDWRGVKGDRLRVVPGSAILIATQPIACMQRALWIYHYAMIPEPCPDTTVRPSVVAGCRVWRGDRKQ